MQDETFGVALAEWRETMRRVDAIGVSWRETRFGDYIELLRELCEIERRRAGDHLAYVDFRRDLRKQELLFEGASQVLQLSMATRVWDVLDCEVLKRKLARVLAGPALPAPEDGTGSDEPRDTLVELLAASLLGNCGFAPAITNVGDDVQARIAGRPLVAAECKRPAGRASLKNAIRKIRAQAWNRRGDQQRIGIAVLAVERMSGFPGHLLKGANDDEVDRAVEKLMAHAHRLVVRTCGMQGCRLAPLTPVGMLTFSGAVLVQAPTMHIYRFVKMTLFDTGLAAETPDWLGHQLNQTSEVLEAFQK